MQNLFACFDRRFGGETNKAVVVIIDLPFGIRWSAMVVNHAASQNAQIIIFIIRAGKQIIIQPVNFLQIVIINNQIGAALNDIAGGKINTGEHPQPMQR